MNIELKETSVFFNDLLAAGVVFSKDYIDINLDYEF